MYKKSYALLSQSAIQRQVYYIILYMCIHHTHMYIYIYIYLVQRSLPKTHGLNLYAHVLSPLNSGKLRKHVGLETLKKLLI